MAYEKEVGEERGGGGRESMQFLFLLLPVVVGVGAARLQTTTVSGTWVSGVGGGEKDIVCILKIFCLCPCNNVYVRWRRVTYS